MHALIVISHPISDSLSGHVAQYIADGITQSNPENSVELADLAKEGFDPRFTESDIVAFYKESLPPVDVIAEQSRIALADALVLVYPVYWWTMPALLKGWIDRVFCHGWAYNEHPDGRLEKKLQHLPVHLVAIGAAGRETYLKHGFWDAMKTQIDHGIFDYCGAPVITSELLLHPELKDTNAYEEAAYDIGRHIFSMAEVSEA
ncbi:putative NAD(P)H oxidoreductase [Xenorhabdus bovienii str. Jollieti]|uniref:Putative NAD(P)H oxidoreductase n=1 Tax=Xenorhabdus bovienii (strain SS-2004) TaxID=406818 RepID=D3V5D2_XENBS|nr:NAD(P)H-dependent oxidoreductase [Xenorhabdus bovienii]CBJ82861.1 putative NAD(P)H oxidoreductase [Xenorhabdus bovienii SS-2004]CDH28634.1 putative NAD(P)H oxidoreductase [Xenorhabdus bovienii str. Jollieti]